MNDERAKEVLDYLRGVTQPATLVDEGQMLMDAADELERHREALKPFAAIAVTIRHMKHIKADWALALVPHPLGGWVELKVADLKRAEEVLK